jgi:hypothetical protein
MTLSREDAESLALERLALEALDALRDFDPLKTQKRGPVDTIWRAIAAGVLSDEDTARWARIVAADVVKNVIDNKEVPEERPRRALSALQLSGQADEHFIEKSDLERMISWEQYLSSLRGEDYAYPSPIKAAEMLRKEGYFEGYTNRNITNRVGKWPRELRPK